MLIAYWYITPVFAGMFFYENKFINTFIHSGPPQTIANLLNITPITMIYILVYDTYNYTNPCFLLSNIPFPEQKQKQLPQILRFG